MLSFATYRSSERPLTTSPIEYEQWLPTSNGSASSAQGTLLFIITSELILGRDVDLLTRSGVEASRNPIRRDPILKSARIFYKAARGPDDRLFG